MRDRAQVGHCSFRLPAIARSAVAALSQCAIRSRATGARRDVRSAETYRGDMSVVGLLRLRVTHAAPEPMERSTRSAARAFARDVHQPTRHPALRQRSTGRTVAVGALGRRALFTSSPRLIETIATRRGPHRTALQLSRA